MTNESTLEKLNRMKLFGMVRAFTQIMAANAKNNFTHDELIGHLVDAEWDDRENRKLNRLLSAARFRYQAAFEQIDFSSQRNLDKNAILRLGKCTWIQKGQSIIISGPTGVGKSFLACALGNLACHNGYSTAYFNCTKLFNLLRLSGADGSYTKLIRKIEKNHLLVLDDFGMEIFDKNTRLHFLEILEDRHGKNSTIITSQLPPNKWHEVIGEPTIADAICDRLIHSSQKIQLKGGSLRKKFTE